MQRQHLDVYKPKTRDPSQRLPVALVLQIRVPTGVVVGTGTHPTVVISGFPSGTTELQMRTGAAGIAGTRVTAPCKKHLKRWRGSMLITLVSGAHENGLVDNGFACGLIKKKSG